MTSRPGVSPVDVAGIADDRPERVTRQQIERFERALDDLASRPADRDPDPEWRRLEEAALRGQLTDLQEQIAAYEAKTSDGRVGP